MLRWHKPSLNKPAIPPFEATAEGRTRHLNRVLERERVRADRSGRPLALVLVGYDGGLRGGRRSGEQTIVEALRQRCRITDEVGWFDRRTGFAVLPDTDSAGGDLFARSVQEYLSRQGAKISFAVYQYGPDDPDRGLNAGGRAGEGAGERRADRMPLPAAPTVSDTAPAVAGRINAAEPAASRPLETVMARPLPWWKRATDIAVASVGLIAASPVLLVAAAAIKLDSPGPVIFKQQRAGLGNVPFGIWKFRTMCADAERRRSEVVGNNELDGPAFKQKNDPRITRVGAFLRKTSVDELPQLVNILKGDMTLVGPRPLPVIESDACRPWQRRRLEVTPGLTCIWQVWGRQGVTFDQWMRMDLRYSGRRTFPHDVKIMLHTVPAVLKQRGAC